MSSIGRRRKICIDLTGRSPTEKEEIISKVEKILNEAETQRKEVSEQEDKGEAPDA